MKYVPSSKTQKFEPAPSCTIYEYGGNDEIDGAVAKINGRYPEAGWAMNTEVSEMIFALEGTGELITKEQRVTLKKGVMALLEKGESYYFEAASLRVFIACTPPWNPEQYVISS